MSEDAPSLYGSGEILREPCYDDVVDVMETIGGGDICVTPVDTWSVKESSTFAVDNLESAIIECESTKWVDEAVVSCSSSGVEEKSVSETPACYSESAVAENSECFTESTGFETSLCYSESIVAETSTCYSESIVVAVPIESVDPTGVYIDIDALDDRQRSLHCTFCTMGTGESAPVLLNQQSREHRNDDTYGNEKVSVCDGTSMEEERAHLDGCSPSRVEDVSFLSTVTEPELATKNEILFPMERSTSENGTPALDEENSSSQWTLKCEEELAGPKRDSENFMDRDTALPLSLPELKEISSIEEAEFVPIEDFGLVGDWEITEGDDAPVEVDEPSSTNSTRNNCEESTFSKELVSSTDVDTTLLVQPSLHLADYRPYVDKSTPAKDTSTVDGEIPSSYQIESNFTDQQKLSFSLPSQLPLSSSPSLLSPDVELDFGNSPSEENFSTSHRAAPTNCSIGRGSQESAVSNRDFDAFMNEPISHPRRQRTLSPWKAEETALRRKQRNNESQFEPVRHLKVDVMRRISEDKVVSLLRCNGSQGDSNATAETVCYSDEEWHDVDSIEVLWSQIRVFSRRWILCDACLTHTRQLYFSSHGDPPTELQRIWLNGVRLVDGEGFDVQGMHYNVVVILSEIKDYCAQFAYPESYRHGNWIRRFRSLARADQRKASGIVFEMPDSMREQFLNAPECERSTGSISFMKSDDSDELPESSRGCSTSCDMELELPYNVLIWRGFPMLGFWSRCRVRLESPFAIHVVGMGRIYLKRTNGMSVEVSNVDLSYTTPVEVRGIEYQTLVLSVNRKRYRFGCENLKDYFDLLERIDELIKAPLLIETRYRYRWQAWHSLLQSDNLYRAIFKGNVFLWTGIVIGSRVFDRWRYCVAELDSPYVLQLWFPDRKNRHIELCNASVICGTPVTFQAQQYQTFVVRSHEGDEVRLACHHNDECDRWIATLKYLAESQVLGVDIVASSTPVCASCTSSTNLSNV